ncbi:MAG: hypothetical protein ACQEQC_00385 [Elusimicrobiota bacterium]
MHQVKKNRKTIINFIILGMLFIIVFFKVGDNSKKYALAGKYPLSPKINRRLKTKQNFNVFTYYELGGWVHFITGKKVFIDSRLEIYSLNLFHEYLTVLSAENNWKKILDKYNTDAVLLINPDKREFDYSIIKEIVPTYNSPLYKKLIENNWEITAKNKKGLFILLEKK